MTADAARSRFDAVVVGAGPAGSTVALQLARAGWSVALVERQPFPRRKVCGAFVAAGSLPLLDALGVGADIEALAGPPLRRLTLLRADDAVSAALPAADPAHHGWGRALERDTLDGLLLDQARAAGALVFQPCAVRAILGVPGAWHCELRAPGAAELRRLRATVVIDAHGSCEDLPSDRPARRTSRGGADLFAFEVNVAGTSLPAGQISLLALDGGYGGLVVGQGGLATNACCIRRDRLSVLRGRSPGLRASEAVEAWLQHDCAGVRQALQGARRDGPWLSSVPLDPGVRLQADDGFFKVGNAAGEAHPILGEGIGMALQSAALLCAHLLGHASSKAVPDAAAQAGVQRAYVAAWRRAFVPRLRRAAALAHLVMRPRAASLLMQLLQRWPGLLTHGARWGGKAHPAPAVPRAQAAARDDRAEALLRHGEPHTRSPS